MAGGDWRTVPVALPRAGVVGCLRRSHRRRLVVRALSLPRRHPTATATRALLVLVLVRVLLLVLLLLPRVRRSHGVCCRGLPRRHRRRPLVLAAPTHGHGARLRVY